MQKDFDRWLVKNIGKFGSREDMWIQILRFLKLKDFCEVGVWKGEFAERLLTSLKEIETYTLIDPWKHLDSWNKPANVNNDEFEEIREEALSRTKSFAGKIREIREHTLRAAETIDQSSLDFIYIDGDHTLRGITLDLHAMLPKLKPGGYIGGDDFCKNIWQHGTRYAPTEVYPYVFYFAEAYGLRLYTLPFAQFLLTDGGRGFEVKDFGGYTNIPLLQTYQPPFDLIEILKRIRVTNPDAAIRLRELLD